MDSAVKPVQNGRGDAGTPNRSWRCCRSGRCRGGSNITTGRAA